MSQRVIVMAGTNKGLFLFESDANRRQWQVRGPFLGGWEVYSVLGDSRHGHRIFAGTSHLAYGPSLRVSEDFGENWQEIEHGPAYAPETGFKLNRIWQIVPGHESQPDTYFAGVDEAGLFVSRDRGYSWKELDGLTKHPSRPGWYPGAGGMCLHTILVHPTNPQRMWVAMSAIGVFRSDDGGESWYPRNTGLGHAATGQPQEEVGYCVHKVELDPDDPNTLYMQEHTGVFMSTDGADTWFPIEAGLPADRIQHPEMMPFGFPIAVTRNGDQFLVPLESSEQRTVKGGKLLVYRRVRGEERWEPAGDVAPDEPQHVSVLRDAMTTDGMEQEGIYFGTTSGELYASLDRGENWQRLPGHFSRILNVKTWCVEDEMPIEVRVPAMLRDCTQQKTRFNIEATTPEDAITRLVIEYPLLRRHIYDEAGQLRQHVLLFYNDDNIKWLERLDVPLKPGDRLSVVQAVSGG